MSVSRPSQQESRTYHAAVVHVSSPAAPFAAAAAGRPPAPDFLCIGAQKAGTTWLHSNLGAHPLVWLPPLKEVDYFTEVHLRDWGNGGADRQARVREARAWWNNAAEASATERAAALEVLQHLGAAETSDAWYRGIFRFARPDQVAGEITPHYSLLPRAGVRHAAAMNPNLRVIVLLRDPAERAFSQACMLAGSRPDLQRVREIIASEAFTQLELLSDYARWIAMWQFFLGRERVLIDYFGRLRTEPEAVLRRVVGFLGLPFHPDLFPNAELPVFVGEKPPGDSRPLVSLLRQKLRRVYDELDESMPEVAQALRKFG